LKASIVIHFLFHKLIVFLLFFLLCVRCQPTVDFDPASAQRISRKPRITPDYTDIVIPPNIAPLNFIVRESGRKYWVKIHATHGKPIQISNSTANIQIPLKQWQALLTLNQGTDFFIDIYAQDTLGTWHRFQPIVNHIAYEKIDPYLVYRLLLPGFIKWKEIGIYQRNLENFEVAEILHNRFLHNACLNCHTFDPTGKKMLLHLRAGPGTGMLLSHGEQVVKVNTKTSFTGHAAYASWHPAGGWIAFAAINVHQFFHATGENREVFDTASDIFLYHIDSNLITTSLTIAGPKWMETYPAWSADGRYLYFCRAPQFDTALHFSEQYHQIKYDLCRIAFDPEADTWGEVEILISAQETGQSIAHPKVSPDNRYLVFCMSAYGNFTIYHPDSDLYLLDLKSGQYQKMPVNSEQCESYHAWSSNSRWLVFSSKRTGGLWAQPYLCYLDKNGLTSKAFMLPQKAGDFYEHFLRTFNLPEFTQQPVRISTRAWHEAAFQREKLVQARLDSHLHLLQPQFESEMPWQPVSTDKKFFKF